HRIDVNGAEPFEVPVSNPFYGSVDTLETIWSIGVRNPWRFSFDALTGDLWIGDVGQNLYEEIDFETAGTGGFNYGWRCYEGNHSFSLGGCEDVDYYTFPIYEYGHSFSTGGFAVTGGYVYRGSLYPGMQGYYIFADYVSGNWWHSFPDGAGGFITTFLDEVEDDISTFGQGVDGELYCADMTTGKVYKITDACGAFDISTTATDYFCAEHPGTISLDILEGVAPFTVLWSTGDTGDSIYGLEAGTYTVTVTDDLGCVRNEVISISDLEPAPANLIFNESGNILSVAEGVAWQWYMNGNPIVGATDDTLYISEASTYSALVTYSNGCSVESNPFDAEILGVHPFKELSIITFPNPASDFIMLSCPEQLEITAYRLFNLQGEIVGAQKSITTLKNVHIDVSALPSGLYNLVVYSSQQEGWVKVQVLR
ncbi:MAG: PQQ-dependent sugar dehydrogenase, partial [Chitinophagales bacterium]